VIAQRALFDLDAVTGSSLLAEEVVSMTITRQDTDAMREFGAWRATVRPCDCGLLSRSYDA
jgi:hypothetical protein